MNIEADQLSLTDLLKNPVLFLAFGFGSGLAPKAPGTFGTLAAIPIYLLVSLGNPVVYGIVLVATLVGGVFICDKASEMLGVHDHGGIVWDEIAGFLITMMAVPFSWQAIAIGFVLFRLFDIWKPWPISVIDKHVAGGFGIMLDDVIAGVFALACISALQASMVLI
ncbi:MAG: phosphatidylglycerophosphatase A [Methylococcales bacterium]